MECMHHVHECIGLDESLGIFVYHHAGLTFLESQLQDLFYFVDSHVTRFSQFTLHKGSVYHLPDHNKHGVYVSCM